MENYSNNVTFERRKSVRFSSSTEQFLYEANVSMASQTTDISTTAVGDENLFRIPRVQRAKTFFGSADVNLLQSPAMHENVKLAISPGTKATESRRQAKLQRLLKMQKKRETDKARRDSRLSSTSKIDLCRTERTFVEGNSKVEASSAPTSQFPYHVPEPRFCDISCIHPSDATFNMEQEKAAVVVCSTPLRNPTPTMGVHAALLKPSTSDLSVVLSTAHISSSIEEMVLASDEDYLMTKDERTQHQMKAMAVWCAMILRSQYEDDEFDIGTTKQEANKVLQDLLAKSKARRPSSTTETKPFSYIDFLRKQKRDCIRESAVRLLNSSNIPVLIRSAVNNRMFSVRADCSVYSDLRLQTTLLRLFLSFHPAWLHLGFETVFKTEIKIGDGEAFAQVISRFIVQRLFSDPKIMKNKKYAIGSTKQIVTDAGRDALHSHFLLHTCLFCYFVETAKSASIIKHNPRMFTKNSAFKCMDDVFAELSREVLSGTGTPLNKAFAKMGFKPSFKQGFADDYNYTVNDFADLTDGVILSKIIELVTGCPPGSLISRLRNPGGDRLRKIGNVKMCLQVALEKGVDVGDIKAESIVAANKEAILEVLWKLVGVYVGADDERNLRRASTALANQYSSRDGIGMVPNSLTGEQFVLHVCKQIGAQLDLKVDSLNDLRDGRLLAGAWRLYHINAPDIRLYLGETLLLKVANAAETDLDVPWGIHHSLGLFTHLYLSRLFSIRELHDAATRIQKAFRSYRFFKAIKNYLSSEEYAIEKMSRATAGISLTSANERTLLATYIVEEKLDSMCADPSSVDADAIEPEASVKLQMENAPIQNRQQLRSVLGKLRAEIGDGKLRSFKEREESANQAIFMHLIVKLQALVRGFLVRKRFQALVEKRKAREKAHLENHAAAATKIQRAFRAYRLRKTKRAERHEILMGMSKAATVIQCAYRMWRARVQLQELKKAKAMRDKYEFERQTAASIVIQSHFRMHLAKKKVRVMKLAKEIKEKIEHKRKVAAAIIVQSFCRGWIARRSFKKTLENRNLEQERLAFDSAACKIQSYLRMFLAKRTVKKMKEEKADYERRKAAAILIQSYYRGWLARRKFAKLLEEQRLKEEHSRLESAARKIQSYFHMLIARKILERKRSEKLELAKTREAAAIVIQSRYRGWVTRRSYKNLLEKHMLEMERMRRNLAACKIQKAYRAYLLRKKLCDERLKKWMSVETAVIGIQKYARGMLARRRLIDVISKRKDLLHNVVIVQSCVRGFLARCRLSKMLEKRPNPKNEADLCALQMQPSLISARNVSSVVKDNKFCIDVERLRRLKRNVRENERMQRYYSNLLEACERKLSEEESSSIPEDIAADQPSTSNGARYHATLADQITAATRIQAWFRGCLTRSYLSEHLHRRRSFMRNYLGNVAAEQPRNVVNNETLDALPVQRKIHDAVEMLFDERMYITKVGAFIINRLTSLSPHLCAYFVVDAQGLAAILDFLDQQHIGRGPATANIFMIIADVFLRVIECREAAVVAEVNARLEDCVGRALHVFHAFYCYPTLVCTFGRAILALYQRPNAEICFGKASFYLRYAQKRFASLSESDPRKAILEELTLQILRS